MGSGNDRRLYRCADTALVRAVAHAGLPLPAWPDLTDETAVDERKLSAWLREVWALEPVAEAIEHASPALARQVAAVCAAPEVDSRRVHRAVSSVIRYSLRMTGRATPFGLFAGVALASFGSHLAVRWGREHRAVARPGAPWLADVITRLESCPQLRERLSVVANNLCFVRGDRLIVPCQGAPQGDVRTGVEASIRYTAAVRMAVEAARSPIRFDQLAEKLVAEFPSAMPAAVRGLLGILMDRQVLISSLRAPSTVTDAFGHLMDRLEAAGMEGSLPTEDLLGPLRDIEADSSPDLRVEANVLPVGGSDHLPVMVSVEAER